MHEFISLDHPPLFPQNCVACMSYTGPFVDTHREADVVGRVYVCASCVRRAARVLGMVKGKQQDRLLQADQVIRDLETQLADAKAGSSEIAEKLGAAERREAALQYELDAAADRETTRAHQIQELLHAAQAVA